MYEYADRVYSLKTAFLIFLFFVCFNFSVLFTSSKESYLQCIKPLATGTPGCFIQVLTVHRAKRKK